MLTRWNDFDRSLSVMDEFRRQMDRIFYASDFAPTNPGFKAVWPRAEIRDVGENYVLIAELPGVSEKDVQLSYQDDTLTLSGERRAVSIRKFSRAFALPMKIDVEKSQATLKDGILTVTLPKHADTKPRLITVQAA